MCFFIIAATPRTSVRFQSKSGELTVTRDGERLVLDFPSLPAEAVSLPNELAAALGARPGTASARPRLHRDLSVAAGGRRDQTRLAASRGIGCARRRRDRAGDDCDFVSRYFAPAAGIPEDPVTGSTHCTLIPYWSQRLGKKELFARQISPRGGELFCGDRGERVSIGGEAVTYVEGNIQLV